MPLLRGSLCVRGPGGLRLPSAQGLFEGDGRETTRGPVRGVEGEAVGDKALRHGGEGDQGGSPNEARRDGGVVGTEDHSTDRDLAHEGDLNEAERVLLQRTIRKRVGRLSNRLHATSWQLRGGSRRIRRARADQEPGLIQPVASVKGLQSDGHPNQPHARRSALDRVPFALCND